MTREGQPVELLGVYHLYQIHSKVSVHKLAWSTQQDSSIYLRPETSLLSTPLLLWTSIITLGRKNDDNKNCYNNFALK